MTALKQEASLDGLPRMDQGSRHASVQAIGNSGKAIISQY